MADVQITGLPDSKKREAIGAVCVHWNLLELMVEWAIAQLQGKPGVAEYQDDLGRRIDVLKELVKQAKNLGPSDKQTLLKVIGEIKDLAHDRHRVVHGLWGLRSDGQLVSVFPWSKNGKPVKEVDVDELRRIKVKTWTIVQELAPYSGLADD